VAPLCCLIAIACADDGMRGGAAGLAAGACCPRTLVLEQPPVFAVTDGDGPPGSSSFALVSVSHASILASGVTVVANRDELIFLDTAGRALTIAGRRGNGPGEFAGIRAVFEADDGIGVFDARQSRVSRYSTSGVHLGDMSIEPRPYRSVVGWLRGVGPVSSADVPGGMRHYFARDARGKVIGEFDSPDSLPSFLVRWTRGDGRILTTDPWLECTPSRLAGVMGDNLYVADQSAGTIIAISPDGSRRVIYKSPTRRRVTDEVRARLRVAYELDSVPPDTIDAVLRRFGSSGDPLPFAWQTMLVDPTGRLWLQIAECLPPEEREWEVIDTAGTAVGTVRVRGAALRAARGDRVLAATFDSLEVPYATLFRVRAPEQR
jgi:hypothetical protein